MSAAKEALAAAEQAEKATNAAFPAKTTLHGALLDAQREMPAVQKTAVNPFYKSRYVSLDSLLESVLPVLHTHGLLLVQIPCALAINGQPALETRIVHAESGDSIGDVMPLVLGDKNDPQGQGSAITYARRYALMAILGLVADLDDDANATRPVSGARRSPAQATPAVSGDLQTLRSRVTSALEQLQTVPEWQYANFYREASKRFDHKIVSVDDLSAAEAQAVLNGIRANTEIKEA